MTAYGWWAQTVCVHVRVLNVSLLTEANSSVAVAYRGSHCVSRSRQNRPRNHKALSVVSQEQPLAWGRTRGPRAPLQRGTVEPEKAQRVLDAVFWEHCSLSLARAKGSCPYWRSAGRERSEKRWHQRVSRWPLPHIWASMQGLAPIYRLSPEL